jgi:hypothetical protein
MRYLKGIVNIDGSKYNLDIVEKNNKLYQNNTELQLTDLPLELLESNLIAGTYLLENFSLENIYYNAIKYGEIDSNVEIEVPVELGVIH